MVTHWTSLFILMMRALMAETISITKVDEFLEALGHADAGKTWDYTALLQHKSRMQYKIADPVRLTYAVCGQVQVPENCNPLLRVASFVCACTVEENLQGGSLPVFMLTLKYRGCRILEYIAAHMVAYAGEVVKRNDRTRHGVGSIQKSSGGKTIPYSLYQDMFPIVCRHVSPVNDEVSAGADSGLIYTACNYLLRAGLKYLKSVPLTDMQGCAKYGLSKVYLSDKEYLPVKYDTVSMMIPQLCRQYSTLPACVAIREQVVMLVSTVGQIHRTIPGWDINKEVDTFNDGRCFKFHHIRHFIPFTVCQGADRTALVQCMQVPARRSSGSIDAKSNPGSGNIETSRWRKKVARRQKRRWRHNH